MKTPNAVCVDACLVVKWLVNEYGSDEALQLLHQWEKAGTTLIAPGLLDYEVGSTLRKKIIRGELAAEELYLALEFYENLGLLLFHLTPLVLKCSATAQLLRQNNIYDVSYLVLAKQQKTDFVTADEKFRDIAAGLYPHVRYYRELV